MFVLLFPSRLLSSLAVLFLSVFLLTCDRSPKKVAVTNAPTHRFALPVPRSREANDAGRFIAGLPGQPGTIFEEIETQEAWKAHQLALDKAWGAVEDQRFRSMRDFQVKQLSGELIENSVVFYPFSGPDSLAVTVFFPHSPTYVLVGLEPPGTLPTAERFAKKEMAHALSSLRETVHSELYRSFFITSQMDHHFRGQVSDGLFPPILHLLVRTQHTVIGYRYVRLDDEGRIVERKASADGPNRGIEIDFQRDGDQSLHKLLYFSVNLSDEKLRQNKPFLTFLSELPPVTSYFKATSYMTHMKHFSIIREQALARSAAILQDDSGIPYKYFRSQKWKVQLFGDYIRPYGSFRWLEQSDLRKAYATTDRKPLGFQIGYGFKRIPSNLLLATKVK